MVWCQISFLVHFRCFVFFIFQHEALSQQKAFNHQTKLERGQKDFENEQKLKKIQAARVMDQKQSDAYAKLESRKQELLSTGINQGQNFFKFSTIFYQNTLKIVEFSSLGNKKKDPFHTKNEADQVSLQSDLSKLYQKIPKMAL